MKYASLCSGIGGLDLFAQSLGWEAAFYCEVSRFRQCVLLSRMRDGWLDSAPIWPDLYTLTGREWQGKVDAVVAGFPCQPFSVAGRRRGAEDTRNLWPEVRRAIGEIRPHIVFLENVSGLAYPTGSQSPYALTILGDLANLGYDARWGIVSARDVGATHRRDRWFCVAYARRGCQHKEQQEPESWSNGKATISALGEALANSAAGGDAPQGAVMGEEETPGNVVSSRRRNAVVYPDLTGLEGWHESHGESTNGWLAWPSGPTERDRWGEVLREHPELAPAVELPVRGVADGPSYRLDRLQALGDAVVWQQVRLAWELLTR